MVRCPHLKDGNHCSIYEKRAIQCRLFPIDARDLRGRFSICGYYFITEEQAAAEAASESCAQVQESVEETVEKEDAALSSARSNTLQE